MFSITIINLSQFYQKNRYKFFDLEALWENMTFNRNEFDYWLISHYCIGFHEKPIILSSGRPSPYFVNLRKLTDNVPVANELLYWVAEYLEDKKLDPDYFYGVPDGATKLGILASYRLGEGKLVQGRKKPKTHGESADMYFIGPMGKNDHIGVFDDVITTGDTTIEETEKIGISGAKIDFIVSLFDRLELRDDGRTAKQALNDLGIHYDYMTAADTLIPLAFKKLNPRKEIREKVIEYLERYSADDYYLNL
jgi:orotate phosphoribosyltransferase